MENKKQSLRWFIFGPTILFLCLIGALVGMGGDVYVSAITGTYKAVIKYFGWSFGPMSFLFVGTLFYCIFSKVGNVRIGGEGAKRILEPWSFFALTISGITGSGLIFYGATEPVYHFMNTPAHIGLESGTAAAAVYSMGQTYMHWTFNMFSIYAILALGCALVVYNLRWDFSASSILRPFLGRWVQGIGGDIIDLTLVFAMVLGNVWMLGSGLLSISSGLQAQFELTRDGIMYFGITAFVLLVALMALRSGIQRAVKAVANFNMVCLYAMLGFFVIVGPLAFSFALGSEGMSYYLDNIFSLSNVNGIVGNDPWPSIWTIAYYGSWAASGPVMALFLGKIGRGYTIRQFLNCIFLGGCAFYIVWFTVFGGTGIMAEMTFKDIFTTIKANGFESGIYVLFKHYPLSMLVSLLYMTIFLLALITTLIAKLDAVASMCLNNVNADNMETPFWLKLLWGIYAGFMGWACATYLGFSGVRMFAGFAGIFGMIITLIGCFALIWLIKHVKHLPDGTSVLSPEEYKGAFLDMWFDKLKKKD